MAVTEVVRDLTNLFNYSTDENPTSQQDYQEAVKNWVNTIINLVDCTMWQPNTEYEVGNVLRTPSLPLQLQLTCTTAGTTGSAEPDYSEVEAGDTVTDGTAVFLVDIVVSDGTMVAEAIKALASTNDVPSGITFPSTSLLSKMISNMNTQDGVQYNLSNANSWYICLGAKYGGLIIQGGYFNYPANGYSIEWSYPIALNHIAYGFICPNGQASSSGNAIRIVECVSNITGAVATAMLLTKNGAPTIPGSTFMCKILVIGY